MFGLWETLYIGLALLGSLFLIAQLLLGNLGDSDFDAELESDFDAGFDVDADIDLDTAGELGEVSGDGGASGVSFLTPLIIAPALAGIGIVGITLTLGLGLPLILHLPLALVGGLFTGYVVFYLLARVLAPMQGSSEVRIGELWGTVAEVITPIPEGRVGEIQFIARGSYHNVPARAITGEAITRGQLVMIERIDDAVAYVRTTR